MNKIKSTVCHPLALHKLFDKIIIFLLTIYYHFIRYLRKILDCDTYQNKKYNFSFDVSLPAICCRWGSVTGSGNYSGIYGTLQRDLTDVAFADLFIIPAKLVKVEFSEMYTEDQLCFIVSIVLLLLQIYIYAYSGSTSWGATCIFSPHSPIWDFCMGWDSVKLHCISSILCLFHMEGAEPINNKTL